MESHAEDLMALDVADTGVLKRDVVHLLLKQPQGINLGDFSGAFYKLHGHHPQLALHGYSSLKCLLTDMKEVVVLEKNSKTTVVKLASGIAFNPWLDEAERRESSEDLDSIEEEEESLRSGGTEDEAGWSQQGQKPRRCLHTCRRPLEKQERLQPTTRRKKIAGELPLKEPPKDLASRSAKTPDLSGPATSQDMGFSVRNSESQKMGEKKSVLAAVLVPILSILRDYPSGLNLQMLTEKLMKHGFDLERFSRDMGYRDTMSCLFEIPGPHLIFRMTPHSCVVRLFQSHSGLPALPLQAASSLPKPPSSSAAGTFSQPLKETKLRSLTVPAEVSTCITDLLETRPWGLQVKKLQKFLLTLKGFDLEKFSIAQGYRDALECLAHQMPELKIEYCENRCKSVVSQGKKKRKKKSKNVQEERTKSPEKASAVLTAPAKVLKSITRLLNIHRSGLRVQKLEEYLMTQTGFDLVKFCTDQGYKDTLEFLERQMPELSIRYRENREKSVVKRDCGGVSKASSRKVPKADPGAAAPLQNALGSSIPVPPTVIPNRPSTKEQHGASSGMEKSSSQPRSDTPSQQPSACPFSGQPAAKELTQPTDAQVLNKSSLTQPAPPEHLDELKQQVACILARHPEGMSLFQFRAAYSATYQHHLPLGHASSAKQRLLEMPDTVALKGYGAQTLLFPVSPEESPTKPGRPVFSEVETAAVVLDDPFAKAAVSPEPAVASKRSVLKTPTEPQPCSAHPLASGPPGAPYVKKTQVLPKGQCPKPKVVASFQEPLRPKVSSVARPASSKAENAAKNLGNSLTEAAGKMEPVVVLEPSLSKMAVAVPAPPLRPSVPSTATHLGAPGNKESSFLQESPPPRPIRPSDPLGENAQARATPGENLFLPESPVVFPAEPHSSRLNGIWTSDSFASRSMYLANPPFSVNIPAPSLFQPVLTNMVAASQPVVYPPFPRLPDTPTNPSLGSPSRRLAPRPLSGTQLQKAKLLSPRFAPPASQNRPARPTPPTQCIEQTDCTRTVDGLDPLQSASRTHGQDPSRAPGFSTEGPPVKPYSFQHLQSPSVEQLENSHHTWLSNMPCSSVPAADAGMAASPSKPVVPTPPKLYDAGNTPVTSPMTPSSSAPQQPASSSVRSSTESDHVPSKPLIFEPLPHHTPVNSAVTSSNAQQSTLLRSSQGSPASPTRQPSCVSFRPDTGYDASCQSTPLSGISRESSIQDSPYFTLPDNQRFLQEESTSPSALQNSPPHQKSDNCILL